MAGDSKRKINNHVVGVLVIIFAIYLLLINAPNYVGYIALLLGIALVVKPNAVKHFAYHERSKASSRSQKAKFSADHNEKSKSKRGRNAKGVYALSNPKKKGFSKNKRDRN
ncbi:MAG: hypothetical protein HY513_02115 [Candidatus Aenigmarchaeota archaeon]|nr:hypothetical protein [Candidatus Aenigmarchaeota archaeon]